MSRFNLRNARKTAGMLLDAVLEEKLSPGAAINRWPECPVKDSSLDAAWQALWHLEADEERHQREVFYLDAQLELLNQMTRYLIKGEALPAYMLHGYSAEHDVKFYYPQGFWASTARLAAERWRAVRGLFEQVLRLS